ncbi:uncharacterized protein [Palaemon carinicauda]|uniref:uncharacterized protein n=1 Tax=Palaemon carinicauda TaxID=392227 RepID=UPI0035B59BF7
MATSKDNKTRERLIATPRKRKSTIPPDEDVRYVTRLVLKKRKLLAEDAEADKPIRILKQEDIKKGRALGVGEFGKVFLCKVRAEDGIWRDAVLKILTLWPSMEDFVRETECLQKLQGIKGVPVLYGRKFSPDLAFVMSYCGGKTLEKFLEDNSSNIPKICQVLSRTAAILSAIHRRGISHNDLHSENVMVDETSIPGQSLPKIIDFGYAMAFGSVLFPEALEDWADFHYDPVVSRDCGTTSAQTDIYSFAKLISRIPDGKKWKQQMNLERLVERALSTNKNIRPSLEEFRRVLLHVKRLEETKRRRKKKE